MFYKPVSSKNDDIKKYINLFKQCFPKATCYSSNYIRWLYNDNPDGHVIGFDAMDGNFLAAHYACLPVKLKLNGITARGLLSLNTATHP